MIPRAPTCIIENVVPLVDGGRYPIKRAVGEDVTVEADIFKDGHDIVSALLKWRRSGGTKWHATPMLPLPTGNDRWSGTFSVFENAPYEFTIEAWSDTFRTWQHEFHAKHHAHQPDLTSETLEGAGVVEKSAAIAAEMGQRRDQERLSEIAESIRTGTPDEVNAIAHSSELEALMASYADRSESTEFILNLAPIPELVGGATSAAAEAPPKKGTRPKKGAVPSLASPVFNPKYPRVIVDRERAVFSQWYEFFPRNAEGYGDRGSTFRDCLPRVEDAIAMGFDVIYFPPIHPIGVTARKGRNNAVTAQPGEPGVPYAIGNRAQGVNGGGHKDVAPELGTLEDFDWLVGEIKKRGLEVALDFAINCSPDHPYVHDHPEWFYKRPDGTIKYAENPPKKYQDVYPLNFHNPNWRTLWEELTSIILFWCKRQVRIFRVDNPHTKPVAFWEYLIGKVQEQFPDAIFLSEAFTKPKMMKALAKAGFTHSYTYFTWRNTKQGLTEYFTELTHSDSADVMRPNLWPNTPDILPSYLQFGGRPAFIIRAVLATTLSPVYGIYSGFELCENAGLHKENWDAARDVRHFLHLCDTDYKQLAKEEYLDSEKYQWRERDWNAPGNIKDVITRLNWIRREHHAFQQLRNLEFGKADNDLVLYYIKKTHSLSEIFLIVVSLDPFHPQETFIDVPIEQFGWLEGQAYQVHDLLNGDRYLWKGSRNYVRLEPHTKPAHVFRVRRWQGRDRDFDHFR
ncbi:MAG TPA: alpha-1,4-glucan--maltose-1-phosphate maltosyltransferase [Chthoniobacteraceae bacterium]